MGAPPGSLAPTTEIFQEGLIIPPLKLVMGGELNQEVVALLCANSRTPEERRGDLAAQLNSLRLGQQRLGAMAAKYGVETLREHMEGLLDYTERYVRAVMARIPPGSYSFEDFLDDDGLSPEPVPIRVTVTVSGGEMTVDFSGTVPQRPGCVNAPMAVTRSAVFYVVLCLCGGWDEPPPTHLPSPFRPRGPGMEAVGAGPCPANEGCLRPVRIIAPEGTVVNARPPAAVAAGNVETSQRIVTHMTNTLNTPVEALEFQFPFRVLRYAIRSGSGGIGKYRGGDGVVRELKSLVPTRVSILSERRRLPPYGLQGGGPWGKGRKCPGHRPG